MAFAELAKYLNGPFDAVQGWCSPFLWQAIEPLANAMIAGGDPAPVAEIGVHHGKFFIGLAKTMSSKRKHYAFDVFEDQNLNLDRSGSGSREIFESNLAANRIAPRAVEIVKADSMTVDAATIARVRAQSGGFSFFSVDGCHMAEHTINDIQIAMQLTLPNGIVFVDDYTNQSWPGVQEGVAKLYLMSAPRFVPLIFLEGKLLLCHISHHAKYRKLLAAHFKTHHPDARVKAVTRFGYDSLTAVPSHKTRKFLAA